MGKSQKLKPKPSDDRKKSMEVQSRNKVESAESLDSEKLQQVSVKPKSLKPEEFEESVGVQESQELEAVGEFQQDQPKSQKLKPKQSDNKKKSVEVQSRNKLENVESLDSEKLQQESIKPNSLKPEEIT